MTEEPDVFKRRKAWLNLSRGDPTKEDIEFMMKDAAKDRYGELETLSIEELDGRRLDASYKGETRQYYVPSKGAWMSGKGIRLDKAYRVFEEDDKILTVREIQSHSEKQAIIQGYMKEIGRILEKNKEKEEQK
jgi:hypothetical protein